MFLFHPFTASQWLACRLTLTVTLKSTTRTIINLGLGESSCDNVGKKKTTHKIKLTETNMKLKSDVEISYVFGNIASALYFFSWTLT